MAESHTFYMNRAIQLALKGRARVRPNPLVGCVIVKNDRIIAEGYHQKFGGPHAEMMALANAGSHARGARLYINLEPCSHWGKTPPCAPHLKKSGIQDIYISHSDPNPAVHGRGIRFLRQSGLKVHMGLLKEKAMEINRPFFTWIKKRRPYVILKMAMSLDGKIATSSGDSKWISSPQSRSFVHQLRSQSDAILVGLNTAQLDDPALTSHGHGPNPVRILITPDLNLVGQLKILSDRQAPTWIVTSDQSRYPTKLKRSGKSVRILTTNLKNGHLNLSHILNIIMKDNVYQLLVEGGGETAWEFISQKLVDEVVFFIAPKIIGGRNAKTPVEGTGIPSLSQAYKLKHMSANRMGSDIVVRGYLN